MGGGGSVKVAECIGREPGSHWGEGNAVYRELGVIGIE